MTGVQTCALPIFIDIVKQSVQTNVDAVDILKYLPFIDKISDTSVTMHMLPGTDGYVDGGSYWLMDEAETDTLLREHFWDELQGDPSAVSIAIEDATGQKMGTRAKEVLERRGLNVVEVTTAAETVEKTKITAHNSYDAAGLMVFQVLRQGMLYSEKPVHTTDVTITLGVDFTR